MGFDGLSLHDWLNAVSAAVLSLGLLYTGLSYRADAAAHRADAESRRIANRLTLTENHQRLWLYFADRPELARVLDPAADTVAKPVTSAETIFVNLAIQQLSATFEAMRKDLTIQAEGIGQDVGEFFSLPVPKAVWLSAKPLLNQDLVAFVETK